MELNFPPEPPVIIQGIVTIFFYAILLGPVIAIACIFKRHVSMFLKRIAMVALVLIIPISVYMLWEFTESPGNPTIDRMEKGIIIWCIISFLSWLYVLYGKKGRQASEPESLSLLEKHKSKLSSS
jgi:hypothetical protein